MTEPTKSDVAELKPRKPEEDDEKERKEPTPFELQMRVVRATKDWLDKLPSAEQRMEVLKILAMSVRRERRDEVISDLKSQRPVTPAVVTRQAAEIPLFGNEDRDADLGF